MSGTVFCPYLSELKECPCEYEKECIKRREKHIEKGGKSER
jgi:hypothetical protein